MDTRPMTAEDMLAPGTRPGLPYVCVVHPEAGCLHSPVTTISDDGVWVKLGEQYSSAHRDCFEAYEAEQVTEAAVWIQQLVSEMYLIGVFCATEESMVALGDVTLRDLLLMWLDNQETDADEDDGHEADIAQCNALLAMMRKPDAGQ